MDNPIRWKQRFDNFEKAYNRIVLILDRKDQQDEVVKMALIQAFEFTFELAWKTLKDYLDENGFDLNSPKEVLRQAFQSEYIAKGEIWLEALKKRNETTHTYDDKVMDETTQFIRSEFFPPLRDWYFAFKKERDE